MGLNEFWLQSNNGKKFSLENLKELKKSDLTNNSALEKIFNIFNTNGDEKLDKTELNSLFITMQKAAQSSKGKDTSIFEQNEAEEFIGANKEFKDLNINASDLFEFLSKLVKPEEETAKEPLTLDKVPFNVNLTEEQAQEKIIQTINEDLANSRGILFDVDNGKVGEKYNKFKNYMYNHPDLLQKIKNVSLYTAPFTGLLSYFLIDNLEDMSELSLTNIEEAIAIQEIGCQNLTSAKEGKLGKKEYFLQNREHLKIMIKRRLLRKDSAGIDFIDRIKDKENLSRKQLYEQMEFYINTMVNQIESLEELKNMQRTLLVTTDKGCEKFLEGIYAKMKAKDLKDSKVEPNYRQKIAYSVKAPVPEEYNTAEPMTFEEVFKFERNQEYSKAKVENYLRQNQKTNFVTSAYNKYQSFKTGSDELLNFYQNESVSKYGINGGVIYNNSQPNPEKQAEKVTALFSAYYENVFEPYLAKQELEKLISENNLKISVVSDENGNLSLDLSNLKSDSEKNSVLRQLLRLEDKKLSEQLKDTLGGEVEDVLTSISEQVESAYTQAYGHEFTQELTSAMAEDNQTFIQRYTGDVSMTGMGLTVVGGILCFTPAAPIGAAMVTVGNTLAIGGMAAESGLGLYEASTRTNLDKEEIEELSKTLVMNAGGFVVGMKAAKTGMKAFHKLIDKKLAEVLKKEMVKGNRVEALKQVFANPEYLKSFMKAAGVKLSADFIISYAGDLVMMGVLDTQDDWMSLLQSNLIGILAGMGGDIKDAAHLGMKGDRYRVLRHKEKTQGLTPKEAEELTALLKDPDIKKEYPEDEGVNKGVKGNETSHQATPVSSKVAEGNKSVTDQRYSKPLTPYTELGNKIFEVGKHLENPEKVKELEIEIEKLRKTEPQKAEELQIVLDMLTNPPKVQDVTDKQIDAVVNYLNDHYDNLEGYFTEQAGEIGISDPKIGRFGHRIKGEWSTRDKIANFIKDAISDEAEAKKKGETYTTKTLFDAFKDVRDKYACRTVFEIGDYTKHPEVASIIKEANALKAQGKLEEAKVKMHQAELKAAELQSEPVRIQLLEAMRKAKEEGKDLTAVRISNYYSEDGIPIFTPAQMHKLKYEAAKMGVDVEFIKLAKEIDPKATTEFVDGASTKKQPSGYTALQINFETKTGEVIEWQYRGELVNEFAEAEHLPYDLRTGKHPWAQYPELEVLYKPIADLIDEHVMPKHAYKQLNKYFTDYYTHLRRLELGFESKEPKLEDYENYTDKDGIKRSYKFDKRLEAKNLMALHFYGEGIKDGLITPERALEEFNTEVEKTAKSQEQILPESSVKINEKTDIEDIKNLTQMIDRFGFDEWDKKYIVNSVQYKHQIPILNKLLECTYKDYSGKDKHIDGFSIGEIMPKLQSTKDAEIITKLYKKYGSTRSWIRTLVTNIDSPYFNLLNKIFETTNMDDSNFNILKAELDTPEKILRAEELMDKLLPSQKMSSESIIKVLSKEINGFDFDKNIKTITEKIETEYGQGTVEAYFNNSLFHIAQKAKTPVQRAAIVELLKYKDKKYFIYEQMNRHDIDRAIEDVLDFIETPEDIKIVNAMFEAKTSDNKNETEIYVSDVRSDIKEILAECKKNRDYLSFVADNARKFFSGEDVIEAMQYAQHISNPEIVTELQKYYTGKPIYNYKTFIDLANDPCKLEAIKFINEFNKNKKQDKQIEITSSLLEYLNDQSSIDYFKFIVDFYKTNNQDRLSYLMEISDSEPKRTAVKMLINYQNKDGSKIINTSTQIKQVLQFIENDSDIQKLSDILTKKKFGFFERTLTFKTVVEEISANPNTKQYVKILKQKYPNVNINEVLQYVKDDNDFNLALKFLEKDRKWDLHLIQKARKNNDLRQALDYILDTNASLIDHIGIDNLTSMKNVYQKVKIMNEAGISYLPYENFKKLKGDYFFTKNYIKDTKSIKEGAKINQFPKDTPLEQILDKVPAGEICTIAGVLHVRENNQLVKLNISLQTYFNLFPRQDRFGTQQGALGDCWLISTMDVLMSSPTGRSKLLQLFSEKDGTVYVTLPNKEAIPFKEGKPISTDNSIFAKHADACTGIRLLEEAVAFVCSGKKVEDISSLADLNKMMNSIVGGQEERGFKLLLGQSGEMPTISNAELFEEILIKYNDNPNVVLRTGINSDVNIPREIASKYDLHNGHAYRIDGYDETSKTVFVVNPHDTRFRIELPLDIYKTYFSEMKLFELNI